MSQSQSRNQIASFVAVMDVVLIFVMGILGNKISELLNIPTNVLLALTFLGLLALAIISYVSSKGTKSQPSTENTSGFSLRRLAPKTMIGIFPFGAIIGMLVGVILPNPYIEGTNPFHYFMPDWISNIFGDFSLGLTTLEFLGVLVGLVLCLMFAITVDAHLAASLGIGYGLALATAVVFRQPINDLFLTYAGETIFWVVIAVTLMLISSPLQKFRTVLNTPRL